MNDTVKSADRNATWQAWQVYVMAVVCLMIGVVVGYLVRGSASTAVSASAQPENSAKQPGMAAPGAPHQMPSLDDMRRMADKQAAPLLAKLQSDPNNADLLNQIGTIYRVTHQFDKAASYYQKSLDANPKNVGPRTDLASCLYYQGNVDGAIAQLEKSLTYDPKHAGTLLNLGLIRWKGKNDAKGAIDAWQTLLKYNPNFEKKSEVQKLIAEAKTQPANKLPQSE